MIVLYLQRLVTHYTISVTNNYFLLDQFVEQLLGCGAMLNDEYSLKSTHVMNGHILQIRKHFAFSCAQRNAIKSAGGG